MEGNQMEGKQVQGLDALGGPIWRATRCNLRHSGIPGQHQGCGYVPEPMDFCRTMATAPCDLAAAHPIANAANSWWWCTAG